MKLINSGITSPQIPFFVPEFWLEFLLILIFLVINHHLLKVLKLSLKPCRTHLQIFQVLVALCTQAASVQAVAAAAAAAAAASPSSSSSQWNSDVTLLIHSLLQHSIVLSTITLFNREPTKICMHCQSTGKTRKNNARAKPEQKDDKICKKCKAFAWRILQKFIFKP